MAGTDVFCAEPSAGEREGAHLACRRSAGERSRGHTSHAEGRPGSARGHTSHAKGQPGSARAHSPHVKSLICLLMGSLTGAAFSAEIIPINAWIHDPVISSVDVTPDGEQLVALTLPDINAPPEVTVWQTRDLSLPPRRFKPVDVKVLSVSWLNDEYLLVVGRQKFDIRVGARPTRWFRNKIYVVDDEGKRFRELFETKRILGVSGFEHIAATQGQVSGAGDELRVRRRRLRGEPEEFRGQTRLPGGQRRRNFRGSPRCHPGQSSELERAGKDTHIRYRYKHPETGPVGRNTIACTPRKEKAWGPSPSTTTAARCTWETTPGRERSVIRPYDLVTRELGEPLYGGGDVEAIRCTAGVESRGVRRHRRFRGSQGQDRAAVHRSQAGIDAKAPRGSAACRPGTANWVSMSDDLTVIVVRSSGPREAGAYYLLVNGKDLVPLGRSFPLLEPAKMADMEFVTYKARDGLEIPVCFPDHASVKERSPTRPWCCRTAARGRGTFLAGTAGRNSWPTAAMWFCSRITADRRALDRRSGEPADNEWGQKMQDDKDDGAPLAGCTGHRGCASGSPYSAIPTAGSRPWRPVSGRDSPYQCAIAGAGLAELRSFDKITFTNPFQRQYPEPHHRRHVAPRSCQGGRDHSNLRLPRRPRPACARRAIAQIRASIEACRQGCEVPGDRGPLAQPALVAATPSGDVSVTGRLPGQRLRPGRVVVRLSRTAVCGIPASENLSPLRIPAIRRTALH